MIDRAHQLPLTRQSSILELSRSSLTKAELIEAVAADAGISKNKATDAVDGVFSSIAEALKKGDKYTQIGFGTFSIVKRATREGRNPQSGATIKIPARNVVKFKASKTLNPPPVLTGR
jgi:DNA-binding protein HU-beta